MCVAEYKKGIERKVFEYIFKGFAGCGGEYDFLRLHTDDING